MLQAFNFFHSFNYDNIAVRIPKSDFREAKRLLFLNKDTIEELFTQQLKHSICQNLQIFIFKTFFLQKAKHLIIKFLIILF
ncbi:hypothetical protein BAX94_08145 [Elizabethkingia meningoseptica]|uniref:Uncharacterized protein n=1 Tax=Elizabethkingia meningoseptica TaxID=238 RepID=A0A1V3U483_ELIME|nr:hypothetical protein BBD33_02225 [Elizabethkingia meningoseptica]AQX11599.1 hypothetical protein BBD35_04025 [Elizabethkingia meningoseptica]AQX46181.1 hypothetical protein B5G46_02220 [Elizabethkingia meningoseptica]KUY15473.1 hypothetical protein ATB99_13415 [Elizabethkingia meningoseptica]ODM52354.1 hypothetical protein BES09_11940 [Elizabethkingia meningoseptica]